MLVEFAELDDGLHAFVVGRSAFAHRRLGVDEASIRARAQKFRFHLAKFDVAPAVAASDLSLRATRSNLAELAGMVLGPVRDLLTTRRVVVVPSPVLNGATVSVRTNTNLHWCCRPTGYGSCKSLKKIITFSNIP